MNDLLELLRTRRSIRQYTSQKIKHEDIETILRAAMLSPSGCNYQPWEFVVVTDRDILNKMSLARTGSADMLKQAACAIVVLGDTNKSTVWCEDCSIAMAHMHLMTHYLQLGSCWIQIRCRDAQTGQSSDNYLRQLLSYPEHLCAEAILSIVVPAQLRDAHELPSLPNDKVHYEEY